MAKILIVDDSSFQRGMIKRILQKEGYELLEAVNGRNALEMVAAHNPDCILLDLIMPEVDGFKFLETLQKQGNKIPIIVLTSDVQALAHQKCTELGAVKVLTKPPKKDELTGSIRILLNAGGAGL